MEEKLKEATKYDGAKPNMSLIPPRAHIALARVLTFGAEKYEDHNWTKGIKWSRILSAIERHLYAIKRGEDIDPESGLLHSAHLMCNAAFLTEYYSIYPQGDDRPSAFKDGHET